MHYGVYISRQMLISLVARYPGPPSPSEQLQKLSIPHPFRVFLILFPSILGFSGVASVLFHPYLPTAPVSGFRRRNLDGGIGLVHPFLGAELVLIAFKNFLEGNK